MSTMFQDCNSLISLPDISNWNTSNITVMRLIFLVFHLFILGIDINDVQLQNILSRLVTFFIFHFDISGNDINELQ